MDVTPGRPVTGVVQRQTEPNVPLAVGGGALAVAGAGGAAVGITRLVTGHSVTSVLRGTAGIDRSIRSDFERSELIRRDALKSTGKSLQLGLFAAVADKGGTATAAAAANLRTGAAAHAARADADFAEAAKLHSNGSGRKGFALAVGMVGASMVIAGAELVVHAFRAGQ